MTGTFLPCVLGVVDIFLGWMDRLQCGASQLATEKCGQRELEPKTKAVKLQTSTEVHRFYVPCTCSHLPCDALVNDRVVVILIWLKKILS